MSLRTCKKTDERTQQSWMTRTSSHYLRTPTPIVMSKLRQGDSDNDNGKKYDEL
jgi:hypothetical protein